MQYIYIMPNEQFYILLPVIACSWKVAPVAVSRVVAAAAPDPRVHKVRYDVHVCHCVPEGAPPRLPEQGAVLELPNDVFNTLTNRIELLVELVVGIRQAPSNRTFL